VVLAIAPVSNAAEISGEIPAQNKRPNILLIVADDLGHKPDHWPAAHGFERDLSLIGGAGSHFSDMSNLVPQRPKVTITRVADEQGVVALKDRGETQAIGMELFGQRALLNGRWKLLDLPREGEPGSWSLYNLESDPAEQFDLAPDRQILVGHMAKQWERYARENGVVLPVGRMQPRPYE